MQVYLFLDESGDHGMQLIDPKFPVLALCGVLMTAREYESVEAKVVQLKQDLWGSSEIIFHSREIRRKEKAFSIFQNKEKWVYFLSEFNQIIKDSKLRIISAIIKKEPYKERPGNPLIGTYGHAFMFIIERCVFCMDEIPAKYDAKIRIIAESRGRDVDRTIKSYLKTLKTDPRGTGYVPGVRIRNYGFDLTFATKNENSIGLQIADLMAHPIAKYVIDGNEGNQAFDVLLPKIYNNGRGKITGYGLKVFPE